MTSSIYPGITGDYCVMSIWGSLGSSLCSSSNEDKEEKKVKDINMVE